MQLVALIILIVFSIVGFAAIFFTTFGTLIILIGALIYAFLTNFSIFTIKSLVLLLVFYLCGEVFENLSVILGTKKMGASNLAVVGAFIGGLAGAALGVSALGIGIIPGTFLGIFLGAFLAELVLKRDIIKSLKAGTGGLLGRLGSIVFKVIIALIMFLIMATRIIGFYS
ncbi:MAG: DUF456 domain-containing protein [Candidatus Omnitrophica bacterium]|nr:DUF456 domain-containing protein [Candidatus Omnitrophota bacterium]